MRVLAEEATAIHLEPAGREEEGFEFELETGTGIEYHQAKRQRTGQGVWTVGALEDAGVLTAFYDALEDPRASCVFASAHAADTLDELSDRARKSSSFLEFTEAFLKTATWRTHFDRLARAWGGASPEWTWEALHRVWVETVGEQRLRDLVALQTELLLDGPREQAVATVVDLLRDRVNERLSAPDLWKALAPLGYRPNSWKSESLLAAKMDAANQRFFRSRRETLIGGSLIKRPEADRLAGAFEDHRIVLLEGAAGMGKSDVLLQFCEQLEDRGAPHLVMRLDRQVATSLPQELGRALGLPGSPPAVLAAAAAGRTSYLVIDQLDAISTTSGRNIAFFECVGEMLRIALAEPRMRIVLACRSFDASHDSRLRRLVQGEDPTRPAISVGPLPEPLLRDTLAAAGIPPSTVNAELQGLLAVPLHLALYLEVAEDGEESLATARTLRDLYDAFWKDKRSRVNQALGREASWTQVLDVLADFMSEKQLLHAPRELIDEFESDAEAMLSSSVLVADGRRLAFFHETFFDYVFARRHAGRQRTMQSLLARDQFLFRRAQVRQILAHGREGDAAAYNSDLRYLLTDPAVRFHLKDLVLAWLATVDEPREAEWSLISPILQDGAHPLHAKTWQALRSPAWFRLVDGHGMLDEWLAAGGDSRDQALTIIAAAEPVEPARVAALLAPYQKGPDDWNTDIATVLMRGDVSKSRDLFDLLLSVVAEGTQDFGGRLIWSVGDDLTDSRPEWGCELLGTYLTERLGAAAAAAVTNPFLYKSKIFPANLHLHEFVSKCAHRAPAAFFEHVWPHMKEIMRLTATSRRYGGPQRNDVWHQPHYSEFGDDLDDSLLTGAELAARALATDEPDAFERLVEEHASSEWETVAYVLFQGFAAEPERFADAAVGFLLANQDRLEISYSSDNHWAARQLIASITPHCSKQQFQALEERVLGYYTSWERSKSGIRGLGRAQFTLLSGFPRDRLSAEGHRRLGEWQRKFGHDHVAPPQGVIGGRVGSPIPDQATRKMKDAHWLGAMRKYASERDHGPSFFEGGASELANQLEQRASEDPVRFARLALSIPDDANTVYFDALLRGIGNSEEEVPLAEVQALVERCHALPDRPCGRWISYPIRRYADAGIPVALLEILSWYAIHDPDPEHPARSSEPEAPEERTEAPKESSESNDESTEPPGRRLAHRGLNSVRGGMAHTLTRIVARNAASIGPLEPALRSIANDPSPAVRAMAGETMLGLLNHAAPLALELFTQLVDGSDDTLLTTRGVHDFLRYRGWVDFDRLEPIIRRMVESSEPAVRTSGAVQATLAALTESTAIPLADRCRKANDAALRLGAARVYGANLTSARHRGQCEAALVLLFDDDEPEIRSAASEAIGNLRDDQLLDVVPLVSRFLVTRAFSEHPDAALHAVDFAAAPPADLVLEICEQVMHTLPASVGIQDRQGTLAHDVSQLLVRAYADSSDGATMNRALDLIDEALERNILGAYDALRDHDRG